MLDKLEEVRGELEHAIHQGEAKHSLLGSGGDIIAVIMTIKKVVDLIDEIISAVKSK